jgi:hypothetical protein
MFEDSSVVPRAHSPNFIVLPKALNFMKVIIKISFIVLLAMGIANVISCSKICDEGYEGNRCDVEIRDRFEGTWNAADEPGGKIYGNTISKGTGILDLVVASSFSDSVFFRPIKATATSNSIVINRYKPDTSKIEVEGNGLISEDYKRIDWTYNLINTYDSPEVRTPYTGVWTRQ